MNRFFGKGDREAWAIERSRGFLRYWFGKFWPALATVLALELIKKILTGRRDVPWQELLFWSSCAVVGTTVGAALAWWNRERLFRQGSGLADPPTEQREP